MLIKDLLEGKKAALTLEQFAAKKKKSTYRKSPGVEGGIVDDADMDKEIYVYPGNTYIDINTNEGAKKYSVVIGNTEGASDDLAEMEQVLYWQFYASEIVDPKDIPRGQKSEPSDWEEMVS